MNPHGISDEKIISLSGTRGSADAVTLQFVIGSDSDYFDGHFPQFKLLPAVAQFDIVTHFAQRYMGTSRFVPSIRRIKFSSMIRPGTQAVLNLTKNSTTGIISYTLSPSDNGTPFSSGTFHPEDPRA